MAGVTTAGRLCVQRHVRACAHPLPPPVDYAQRASYMWRVRRCVFLLGRNGQAPFSRRDPLQKHRHNVRLHGRHFGRTFILGRLQSLRIWER